MTGYASFALIYFAAIVGIIVFVLVLLARFVRAHQRCAEALEVIARKLSKDAETK